MRRPAAFLPIVLALGAIILAPRASAQTRDAREEGPIEIEKYQTIDKPGSYKLVKNLTLAGLAGGTCLSITANNVTIDLAGFTIRGPGGNLPPGTSTTAIAAVPPSGGEVVGIAVRNGSISDFFTGVNLGSVSIVEGLRLSLTPGVFHAGGGITADGIVRGNIVEGGGLGDGINSTGIVTGNIVEGFTKAVGIGARQGSSVIGNILNHNQTGIAVTCPSNVTENTAINNPAGNLLLNGDGCNNTNNVAPLGPGP